MSVNINDSILKNDSTILSYKNEDYNLYNKNYIPFFYRNFKSKINLKKNKNFLGLLNDKQKQFVRKISTSSCILNLPTGFGKTVISLFLISGLESQKSLVICPRKIIQEQWIKSIKKFIPSLEIEVYCNKKFLNEYTEKQRFIYDTVIIDEIHMNINMVIQLLLKLSPKYLFGLTATLPETKVLNHFFDKTLSLEENKSFTFSKVDLSFQPNIKYIYRPTKMIDYMYMIQSLVDNNERFKCIIEILKNIQNRVLILTKNISTVKKIGSHLQDVDLVFGTKNSIDFSKKYVVGTYSKLSMGFDSNTFETLCLLDNILDVRQSEGRLRNQNFHILDFVDNHFIFERHWNERKSWYLKRGGIEK